MMSHTCICSPHHEGLKNDGVSTNTTERFSQPGRKVRWLGSINWLVRIHRYGSSSMPTNTQIEDSVKWTSERRANPS